MLYEHRKVLYTAAVFALVGAIGTLAMVLHFLSVEETVIRRIGSSPLGRHAHILDETWSDDSIVFAVDDGEVIKRFKVSRTACTLDTTMFTGTLRWEFAKQSSTFREFWPKQLNVCVWFNPQDPTLRSVSVMEYPDPDGVRHCVPVSASTRILPNRTLRSLMDVPQLRQGEELPPPIILYKPPAGAGWSGFSSGLATVAGERRVGDEKAAW